MQKVIFIAGVERSGSTVLDKLIGSNDRCVSMGEIYLVYKSVVEEVDFKNMKCSCEKNAYDCNIWLEVVQLWKLKIESHVAYNYQDAYIDFVLLFQRIFPDKIIVDSSKYFYVFEQIKMIPNLEIFMIHTIRDVRAWIYSKIQRRRRKGLINEGIFWYIKSLRSWQLRNGNIYKNSFSSNHKYLILHQDLILEGLYLDKLNHFLDDVHIESLTFMNSGHNLLGNRSGKINENTLKYDNTWRLRSSIVANYLLLFINFKTLYWNWRWKIISRES